MSSSLVNVAVDVGRSTVKTRYGGSQRLITKSYASKAASDSVISSVCVDHYAEEAVVDGVRWLLGDRSLSCNPDTSYFLGESSVFHNFSLVFILYHLAVVSHETGAESFNLAINLTFNSKAYADMYSSSLKGRHAVGIVVDGVSKMVKFSVERLFCFYQGYSSLFSMMSDKELRGSSVLVVDVGSQTVDVSLVRDFTVELGRTFNLGMNRLVEGLRADFLAAGVVLSDDVVSEVLASERAALTSLSGTSVDVRPILRKALDRYSAELVDGLMILIGDRVCDYTLVVGGGAHLVRPYLERRFPSAKALDLPSDPIMANAEGMLCFLSRL